MIVLCYHDVATKEINPWTLAPDAFREHLQVLSARGYRSATLEEMMVGHSSSSQSIVITFDDGRWGCSCHARALLSEFNFIATFYICCAFIDSAIIPSCEAYSQFISWSDVRELAASGHTIGSHAMTHRSFRHLSERERRDELVTSRSYIEDKTGRSCIHFAAPYGWVDFAVGQEALQAGYATVATTVFGINKPPISPRFLKRWEIRAPCPGDAFERTLKYLEEEATAYRVLIVTPKQCPSDQDLERLAQYDVILSSNAETQSRLAAQGLTCVNKSELGLGPMLTGCDLSEASSETLAAAVKWRCQLPAEGRVRFEAWSALDS
jgi:peptidoglycan/xylan/chitin deacetylase (PgdA/CDA1 family)